MSNREVFYAYISIPYHRRVIIWSKMGWGRVNADLQTEDREFFKWVVANKKVDELVSLLNLLD